jgi:hypothetical protein
MDARGCREAGYKSFDHSGYINSQEKAMPVIKIPSNVYLQDASDQPIKDDKGMPVQVDFVKSFLLNTVLNDPKWGKDMKSLFASIDLAEAFKKSGPDDEVLISQDGWEKLKEVMSEPSSPYNTVVMRQAKAFFTAITNPHKP